MIFKKTNFLASLAIIAFAFLIITNTASAGWYQDITGGVNAAADSAGITKTKAAVPTMIGLAINSLFGLVGLIFLAVILIGGYFWLTAAGKEENISKAKAFILNGIFGLIVVIVAYALAITILYSLGSAIIGSSPTPPTT